MSARHSIEVYEQAKELLRYDPESGLVFWKENIGKARNGDIAGWINKHGHVQVRINRKSLYVHRLAWFFTFGELPIEIDHIDHNPLNNRIENLRSVVHRDNMMNQRMSVLNTSGVVGVGWRNDNKKWRAEIEANGVREYLGCFNCFDDAVTARKQAELKLGFHKNHGKQSNIKREVLPRAKRLSGVSFCKRDNRWYSRMRVDGKFVYLGYFKTESEARNAREAA